MAYNVHLTPRAEKEFAALPSPVRRRVAEALRQLAQDPRPHGCLKLVDAGAWRLRVGDHRLVYDIDDGPQEVTVFRIEPRKDVYRRR